MSGLAVQPQPVCAPAPPPEPAWVVVFDNARWPHATPRLSVLIPFHRDDPRQLLATLDREARALDGAVEIVLLDDGGGDAALTLRVRVAVEALALPARLIALERNEGRAKGRNRLASHGRARQLLFLDSDMAPDSANFLATYLHLIEVDDPAAVFGGFSVDQAPPDVSHALHRALAARGDCLAATVRQRSPEKYIFTSNLLVRRDVFEAEAFDERFCGWGWEDVEWGARVSRRFGVRHIDNTATHLGLDTAETLASKYEQSVANFGRLAALHPQMVKAYPSYRLAKLLKGVPAGALWRKALKRVALSSGAPLIPRVVAMKLYRAALYAEVV